MCRSKFSQPRAKSVYWAKSVLKRESTALRSLLPSLTVGRIFSSLSSGRFAGTSLRAGISHLTGTEMPRIANGEVWLLHRTAAGVGVAPLAEHPALGAAAGAADALLQRGSEASEAVEQL